MILFLAISSTYDAVHTALFKDNHVIESIHETKFEVSKKLLVICDTLLKNNDLTLSDLDFIAVNQGPGPFTTLRTVITCANGISFASDIPLVGVNSLTALFQEYNDSTYPQTVALLNAFGNDVYWATAEQSGCSSLTSLLEQLKITYPKESIRFIGNGTQLHEQTIQHFFGSRAFIQSPMPEHCSVEQIGKMALEQWKNKQNVSHQLLPIYLKDQLFTR